MANITAGEPLRLTPVLWQLHTEHDGEERFYFVARQYWTHGDSDSTPVLVVAAINTYRDDAEHESPYDHGDYACYIGSPPLRLKTGAVTYDMAAWVAEHGVKLTETEAKGLFGGFSPNNVPIQYRR